MTVHDKITETLKIRIGGKIENLEFFLSKMWQVNLWLNYSSKHIGLVFSLRSKLILHVYHERHF